MLRLTATWDDQVRQFPLSESGRKTLRLGAAPENDLVLPAPGVSRLHARLDRDGRSLVLTDLDSKNGLVRDHRRHPTLRLDPGGPAVFLGRAQVYLEEVAPGDVEIALELDGSGLPSGSLGPIETAALRLEGAPSSPGGALRLVRELEGLPAEARHDRRQDLLEKARRVLGAEALLAVDREDEQTLLVEQAGRLPDEKLLEELAPATPETGSGSRTPDIGELEPVDGPAPRWRVLGSLGSGRGPELFAVLPGDARDLAWRRDLLVVLAARLFGAEGEENLADETAISLGPGDEEQGLVLPDEMVVGPSPALRELLAELRSAVRSDLDLLLTGETGSGKELIAQAIHSSSRPDGPFVALNCAAIPGELLEAELFGVEAGVATGVEPRTGRLVAAEGGTLFLDEIGELDGRLQAKLLRVLQEREVLPLGARGPRKVDVRFVSATNRDLAVHVEEGRFRSDLYFRLRGLELRVPPLRHRREDLSQLVLAFGRRAADRYGKRVRGVSRAALGRLLGHDWPGNVRELKHAVERAVLRCPDGGVLDRRCFGELTGPRAGSASKTREETASGTAAAPGTVEEDETPRTEPRPAAERTLQEQVDEVERRAILEALSATGGNKTRAAKRLGITRNGLNLKIKRLEIQFPSE